MAISWRWRPLLQSRGELLLTTELQSTELTRNYRHNAQVHLHDSTLAAISDSATALADRLKDGDIIYGSYTVAALRHRAD